MYALPGEGEYDQICNFFVLCFEMASEDLRTFKIEESSTISCCYLRIWTNLLETLGVRDSNECPINVNYM